MNSIRNKTHYPESKWGWFASRREHEPGMNPHLTITFALRPFFIHLLARWTSIRRTNRDTTRGVHLSGSGLVESLDNEAGGERLGDLVSLDLVLDNEGVKVLGETKLELGSTVRLLDLNVCKIK